MKVTKTIRGPITYVRLAEFTNRNIIGSFEAVRTQFELSNLKQLLMTSHLEARRPKHRDHTSVQLVGKIA